MYKTKAAVVGAGFIGPVHVEGLKRLGVTVTGILGVNQAESERARDMLSLPRAYQNFEEVLADPGVDAVHLAVPNRLHYELSRRALEAGKHVMCEKPLAMTSAETQELTALAKKTGLHAAVSYNIRFYPLNVEARVRVRRGDLGPVYSVSGGYVQDWLLYDTDYNWRVLADEGGALRAVADIGTHWIDLVTSITGLEVEAVFADLYTIHTHRRRPKGEVETFTGKAKKEQELIDVAIDTEDAGAVLFRFKGGARGVMWVSQATAGRKNSLRYEIAGAKEALAWNSEQPNELWIGHRERANESLTRDPSLMDSLAATFSNYPGGHNEGFPDTHKQCFRAFYNAIEGKMEEVMYPTFAEGHKEVAICEAILQSHREERWVKVES